MAAREPRKPRHATGRIRRVARVSADDVPADYPVDFDASRALAFEVERDESDADGTSVRDSDGHGVRDAGDDGDAGGTGNTDRVKVYEGLPGGGHAGSRLARLLDAVGESTADPGALRGERVALERRGGDYRIDVEGTRRLRAQAAPASVDTHSLTEIPILLGAVAGLLAFFATQTAYDSLAVPVGVLAAVTLAVSLGFDAWQTVDATWSPRALPWATGGLVPVVNVGVAAAYLARKTAVVDDPEGADEVWRDVLVGATVAFAAGLALAAFEPLLGVGATLFVHAWALAPVAVYLDGGADRHDGAPPNRAAWVAGAVVLGAAGALIYLLRTDIV